MSPNTFLCWLAERPWFWPGFRRLQPRPNQNYPWAVALIAPMAVTALVLLVFTGLVAAVGRATGIAGQTAPALRFWFGLLGVFVMTSALLHWFLTALSWNQRAARIRAEGAGSAAFAKPGTAALVLLAPIYIVGLWVITPWAFLTAVENARGALKWRAARAELISRGEFLTLRDLAPNPSTYRASDNFFSVPPFAQLLLPRTEDGRGGRVDTNALQELKVLQLPSSYLPKELRNAGASIPLEAWAGAFRNAASNQARASRTANWDLPEYPELPAGADAPTTVLTALAGAGPLVQSVCDASQRPRAGFPVAWEDGFLALLPHLNAVKNVNTCLDLRARAKLAAGDRAGAFSDAECSLRIANVLREEPLLISQLVRFAQAAIAARTVGRGIESHAWNDSQLAAFQRQLLEPDYWSGMILGIRGERAGALAELDRWVANRSQMADQVMAESALASQPLLEFVPSGWIRDNQVVMASAYGDLIAGMSALTNNLQAAAYGQAFQRIDGNLQASLERSLSPRTALMRMLLGPVGSAVSKNIRAIATARCAATGCALERYRLRHGAYPENLGALVPEWISSVPLDPMDAQPLRYARDSEGSFRLWSIGANGKDDGGQDQKPVDLPPMDWVWSPGR